MFTTAEVFACIVLELVADLQDNKYTFLPLEISP